VPRDQPARFIFVALLGLVRNWFEERNLVQDESDPQQVAQVDAAYLQTLWAVVSRGVLAQPAPADGQAPPLGGTETMARSSVLVGGHE
jgi:hypothetical protein